MVIKPMIRNNLCMNAHPVGASKWVDDQIEYARSKSAIDGPKRVLVIGGSGGYGLSSRLISGFAAGAGSINVAFEREPTAKRTGTVGWYTSMHLDRRLRESGLVGETIMGDAFSYEIKQRAIDSIREKFGTVDLVVYSLASGVRTDPDTGVTYRSALKPIGREYTERSLDPIQGTLSQVTISPATDEEIDSTVKVMGGEDWMLWMKALAEADVLAEGVQTVAYSYIGPELTYPVYRHGTIGRAKDHLEATASRITEALSGVSGAAYVSVNKAVVTRASAVIPVVSLYLAVLFRVMKDKELHEDCTQQIYRLLSERLYARKGEHPRAEVPVDEQGRIRVDDWEFRPDVQEEVTRIWQEVNEDNLDTITDLAGYRHEFLAIHGFDVPGVDYDADVAPDAY
ncbi:MAG: enoyl-ACP reductase FabV [Spirochaetales bacterium]